MEPLARTCPVCRVSKELIPDNWHRNRCRKDGFQSYCKECQRDGVSRGGFRRVAAEPKVLPTFRTCPSCGKRKDLTPDNWHRNCRRLDGYQSNCKICQRALVLARAQADPEANRRRSREWAASAKGKEAARRKRYDPLARAIATQAQREYYARNRERLLIAQRVYNARRPTRKKPD